MGSSIRFNNWRPAVAYRSVVYRQVSDNHIVNAFNNLVGNTGYVSDAGYFCFTTLPTGHSANDLYYFKVVQGSSSNTTPYSGTMIVAGFTGVNAIEGYTQELEPALLDEEEGTGFTSTEMVGRKIKISIEHSATIKCWAEGASFSNNEIVYSDGHYYLCNVGGTAGKSQPVHTQGTYSDGAINWTYLHSGFGYITITSVESSTSMTGNVTMTLPYTSGGSTDSKTWNNFQWSMWGYRGKYPNQVFMFNGRLGYTLATAGFGSWLQMSKADEFNDFSTEEYGEVTDICGINTLISEYNENKINWVLSGYRLYMGSYAGEYNINGGSSDANVITPSACSILPVSQAGGGMVKACKFEDLNLFASADRRQLFSLKYDYTTDDYIPSDIGFAGEDLLDSGIASMWHLRGYDRNLYLRTEDNKLMCINQAQDVKALGFFRVDMQGDVLDHCVSNANGESVQFALVKRGNTYDVEFIQPDSKPYMLNTKEYVGEGTEGAVASTITDLMFANQTVYVCNESTGEFQRTVVGANGVIANPFSAHKIIVGIEMPCEVHTHPLYNDKQETAQQKSVRYTIRLVNSGAFSYGSSQDYTKWYDYNNYNTVGSESYGTAHDLMTGDIKLPAPFGYQSAQNKADSKYPNDSAIALNIKASTPEPFNLLLVNPLYV